MTSRRLLNRLGVVGLVLWVVWWLVSFSRDQLLGIEYFWLRVPMLGADFWSQTDYASRLWVTGGDPYLNEKHFFHYPPIVIRLFRWTPFFPRGTALHIWTFAIMGFIALGTVVALKTRRKLGLWVPPAPLAVLGVLLTFTSIFAAERANFDLIVLVPILLALKIMERGGARRDFLAGCVLAVAPWVKLYPGLMAVGLVGLRRFWTLAGFAFAGVGIGLLTPSETLRSFHIIGLAVEQNYRLARLGHYNWWSHSLSIAWIRATLSLSKTPLGPYVASVPPMVAAVSLILPLLGWVTYKVFRSRHAGVVAYPLLLWLCALASCLPIIANDYSLIFLPMAAMAVYGKGAGRLAHLTMLAAVPWWQPFCLSIIPPVLLLVCKLCGVVAVGASVVRRVEALDEADARDHGGVRFPSPVLQARRFIDTTLAQSPFYVEIFTTALGGLLLEVAYTRIFSFKVFYYFTYVLLGVGLLGIGAGGIAVATSERLRKIPAERLVPVACFAGGASVLVGYLIIAPLQINIAQALTSPSEIGKFVLVTLLLTASFFCVGLVISTILASRPEAASKLYGADLLGAALGCALAIPLIATIGPPRAVMLAGLFLTMGGLRLARRVRSLFRIGVGVAIVLGIPAFVWGLLPDPKVAETKMLEEFRKRPGSVWFSQWSPVFRVDVITDPFSLGRRFITFHDGQIGSSLNYFDGKLESLTHLDKDPRALPFAVAPPNPNVLVIGAAGGKEVLASLYFKASHVTGVELNPVTYSLVTTTFADITGHLAELPKVTFLNGDGRWFLKQTKDRYDLIWFVAPDSYAAMNASTSGAFVLSESYLYTVEMVRESLRHLTPGGIIGTHFGELSYDKKPNRTTRYLATARAALAEEGISSFDRHVLVSSAVALPPFLESVVLTGKQEFSSAQIDAFTQKTATLEGGVVRYTPTRSVNSTPPNQVIALAGEELSTFFERHPYQVGPVRDDAPFFWHFARFRDVLQSARPSDKAVIDQEDFVAEQVMIVFLAVVVVLALAFLLLPLLTIRRAWAEMPHKALSLLYFAALGLGFMFLEVALIQKLTLLLGYPTYSLSVTLFALLLSSGSGSLLTARRDGSKNRVLVTTLGVLAGVVLIGQALLPAIIDNFVGSSLPVRVVLAVLIISPAGLCMGAFMPIGLRSVSGLSKRSREYVAWAWAINGFFSVIASILSTVIGMVLGFRGLLFIALGVYVVGVLAMTRVPDPKRQT